MKTSIAVAADSLALYLSISRWGRRTLRRLKSGGEKRPDSPGDRLLGDAWERKRLFRDFRMCDRSFFALVPRGLDSSAGPNLEKQYARLVPFAWFGQAVRTHILEAFEVEFDAEAERRSVLQSFVHREWNDLTDSHNVPLDELFRACYEMDKPISPRLELLRQLNRGFLRLVPQERFSTYYRMVDEVRTLLERPRAPESAQEWTSEVGKYAARISLCVMKEDLPERLESVLGSFGLWLYALDAFADIDDDSAAGKPNYFHGVEDGAGRLMDIALRCEKEIRAAAPRPERFVPYMSVVTEGLIHSQKGGRNIESGIFGA